VIRPAITLLAGTEFVLDPRQADVRDRRIEDVHESDEAIRFTATVVAMSMGPAANESEDFRVQAAVAELPEPERVPLELACWGGRSQSEIAELRGLPLGTVESRTRSALSQLAVRLGDSDERAYV
jgi:DNA-directed RNA polymerase specialized sigma24 family protein